MNEEQDASSTGSNSPVRPYPKLENEDETPDRLL
jgi:hypothetical protein